LAVYTEEDFRERWMSRKSITCCFFIYIIVIYVVDVDIYFSIIILAGDITDAKLEDREGSRQFEDEWRQYDRILQETGVLDKTVWLDTRGNHGMYRYLLYCPSVVVAWFNLFTP